MTDPAICPICGGSELEHSYHAPHMVQLVAAVGALADRLAALETHPVFVLGPTLGDYEGLRGRLERVEAALRAAPPGSARFQQFVARVGPLPTTGLASAEPPRAAEPMNQARQCEYRCEHGTCSREFGHEPPHRGWKQVGWEHHTGEPSYGDAMPAPSHSAQSAAPVVVDWLRFVPTEEIQERGLGDWIDLRAGDVVASTLSGGGGRVVKIGDRAVRSSLDIALLASDGRGDADNLWSSSRYRIIRHADGRWADGYGPDGPLNPAPSSPPERPVDVDREGNPCAECGTMLSAPEGGTTFTVCDECWDHTAAPPTDGAAPTAMCCDLCDGTAPWPDGTRIPPGWSESGPPENFAACDKCTARMAARKAEQPAPAHDENCATRTGTSRNCDCSKPQAPMVYLAKPADVPCATCGQEAGRACMAWDERRMDGYHRARWDRVGREPPSQAAQDYGRLNEQSERLTPSEMAEARRRADRIIAAQAAQAAPDGGRLSDETISIRIETSRLILKARKANGCDDGDLGLALDNAVIVALAAKLDAAEREVAELNAALVTTAQTGADAAKRAVDAERTRLLELLETYEPRRLVPSDFSYQGALERIAAMVREWKAAP